MMQGRSRRVRMEEPRGRHGWGRQCSWYVKPFEANDSNGESAVMAGKAVPTL